LPSETTNSFLGETCNSLKGYDIANVMKKRSESCKRCALAVARRSQKKISPPQTPFPGGAQDFHNLISWRRSPPLPTNPVWWRSMHAISSYRVNRPTHKQTHRQDRLQYTAPQLARSVIMYVYTVYFGKRALFGRLYRSTYSLAT